MSIDQERLKALLCSPLLEDILSVDLTKVNRDEFRKFLGLDLDQIKFELLIDYNQTMEQMISAGRYDWFNNDITTKRFPVKGEGKVSRKAELIRFNRSISSDGVIAELDKMGKRPATIEELLAFGAQYPEIQREFPVVALGSSAEVSGLRCVACLYGDGSERYLRLYWWDGSWDGSDRFLVFDK